jgi:sulfite reductase (NADPH) hemoprotein beta-component
VLVGGGMGRTPIVGQVIREFVPWREFLNYVEAILRVYNRYGRRDNIYKARIKILVNALGIDEFRRQVEAEWHRLDKPSVDLPPAEYERIAAHFAPLPLKPAPLKDKSVETRRRSDAAFDRWVRLNVMPHRVAGHAIVNISLKEPGRVPGDATAAQMDAVAEIAERLGHGEIRVTYQQNLVLPNVAVADLDRVYVGLLAAGLATANTELVTDIIACPGLDYCNLANARSIPIAKAIAQRFAAPGRAEEIGPLRLNISGCINACGHHHAGNIGILGVDKKGTEHYQITLGGSPKDDAAIGDIVGPSYAAEQVPDAVATIVEAYLRLRRDAGETFLEAYRRLGKEPFRTALYGPTKVNDSALADMEAA